jgi:hypothetical protein
LTLDVTGRSLDSPAGSDRNFRHTFLNLDVAVHTEQHASRSLVHEVIPASRQASRDAESLCGRVKMVKRQNSQARAIAADLAGSSGE